MNSLSRTPDKLVDAQDQSGVEPGAESRRKQGGSTEGEPLQDAEQRNQAEVSTFFRQQDKSDSDRAGKRREEPPSAMGGHQAAGNDTAERGRRRDDGCHAPEVESQFELHDLSTLSVKL